MEKKFNISGMPENIQIPEDESEKKESKKLSSNKEFNPEKLVNEIMKSFNISQEEFDDIMTSFSEAVSNGVKNMDPNLLKALDGHIGADPNNPNKEERFAVDKEGLEKIFEYFLQDKKSSKDNISLTTFFFEQENKENDLNDDVAKNICGNFEVLADNESFGGVVNYIDPLIYEKFKKVYGEPPYKLTSLSSLQGYNLIKGLENVKELNYISHTDKYIMFLTHSENPNKEPFLFVVTQASDSVFEVLVPQYGNAYDMFTEFSFDRETDSHLYELEGVEIKNLKKPIDYTKVSIGLDLLLYEQKKPILSIKDFGEVLTSMTPITFSSNVLKIGRIKSNESKFAKIFKRDFNIDDDKNIFDFYVKFKEEFKPQTLEALQKYVFSLDFNSNSKLQTYELNCDSNHNLFIELDLGELPNHILKWIKDN
jgi:hypothetical protein